MFHSDGVGSVDRMDKSGHTALKWAALAVADENSINGEGDKQHQRAPSCETLCR